jgi:hypothetical protein
MSLPCVAIAHGGFLTWGRAMMRYGLSMNCRVLPQMLLLWKMPQIPKVAVILQIPKVAKMLRMSNATMVLRVSNAATMS